VDTSTSAGRAFFGMLAMFAAFETDVRREHQAEGIAKPLPLPEKGDISSASRGNAPSWHST